jgi:hypothetical protein
MQWSQAMLQGGCIAYGQGGTLRDHTDARTGKLCRGEYICDDKKWVELNDPEYEGEARSCKGWDCRTEDQFCPEGVPGAWDASYTCDGKKWVEVTGGPQDIIEARCMNKCRTAYWTEEGRTPTDCFTACAYGTGKCREYEPASKTNGIWGKTCKR